MKRLYSIAACLALGGVLVAGCGGSSSKSSSNTTSSSQAATPAPAAAGGAVAVKMQNIQFSPKSVTAKVGQTVKWTNDDSVDHNVIATSGATFKSSIVPAGSTYSFKATKAGTIQYVCTIHPGMAGTLVVTK